MSRRMSIPSTPQMAVRGTRLHHAQQRVAKGARRAAMRMAPAAGQARRAASAQVKNARGWSAPWIDRAGHYVEHEIGPRVGMMLHRAADRIEPKTTRRNRRGIAAALMAVGGALGAAGAVATRRNQSRSSGESGSTSPDLSAVSDDSTQERARSH